MIRLEFTVENTSDLLETPFYGAGALGRWESAAAQSGTYVEGGTFALVSGTSLYVVPDAAGIPGETWYRMRISNAAGSTFSAYSAVRLGGVDSGLCSLADARQRIGITSPTDHSQDENLLQWITQAGDWLAHRTGRCFTPDPATGTKTYLFDGDGSRDLFVPRGVRSITTLEMASATGGAYVAATDFFLRPGDAVRSPGWPYTRIALSDMTGAYFWPGYDTVKITGTFGFAAVPPAIEQLALTLVVAAMRETSTSGGETVTINADGSRMFERALSRKDRDTLDMFSDVSFRTV